MRIERVVIGVDFSDAAQNAVRWAGRFLDDSTELVLVHVVEIPHPPSFLRGDLPPHEELVETARIGALTRLTQVGLQLSERTRLEVRAGRAAAQISQVAGEVDADLIIAGEHGQRRGLWKLLGSTAERLIHNTSIPVLVTRGGIDVMPATILAPLDETPDPAGALRWTAHLAARFGSQVSALHVLDPAITGRVGLVSSYGATRDLEDRLSAGARRWLEAQVRAAGIPMDSVKCVVSCGNAGYEILAAAERFDVQLIVLTTRGGGPIEQRLLGSVARTVLRGASCSVLVVPAET